MDEWVGLLAGLLFWRIVLVTSLGLVVAMGLAALFPSMHGGVNVALVLFAFGGGLLWHVRATEPLQTQPRLEDAPISKPVAFLGLMAVGIGWGGILQYATGSNLLAATALLLSPFVFAPVATRLTRRSLPLRTQVFGACAMITGYAVPLVIGWPS